MAERSDLELFARALRNDWPIPPDVKLRLLQSAINIADPIEDDTEVKAAKKPSQRTRLAALKVVALYCKLTIEQQRLDLLREKLDGSAKGFVLSDSVADAELAALEYVPDTKPE